MEYKFSCEKCSYFTNIKQHFENHNNSKKHNNVTTNTIQKNKTFECKICKKEFKCSSGLWRHKKICIEIPQTTKEEKPTQGKQYTFEVINELVNDKNNMEIITKILYDGLNNYEILENKLVPFSNNNTTNKAIIYKELKEEIKEELKEEFNDKIERFFISVANSFFKNNINYYDFINQIQITRETRDKFAIEFEQPINDALSETINKVGIDNSPLYCARNTEGSPFIILNLDKWRLFPYNERTREPIKEIAEPITEKFKTELDKLCDENTNRRNGYKQHYNKLSQKDGLKNVLNDGIYQKVEVTVKDIKKIIHRKKTV